MPVNLRVLRNKLFKFTGEQFIQPVYNHLRRKNQKKIRKNISDFVDGTRLTYSQFTGRVSIYRRSTIIVFQVFNPSIRSPPGVGRPHCSHPHSLFYIGYYPFGVFSLILGHKSSLPIWLFVHGPLPLNDDIHNAKSHSWTRVIFSI